MNYWLMKSEPEMYSWQKLVKEGRGMWDGVRNFQARNNLKAMKKGDRAFFYHSVEGKEIVGIAEVVKEFYPDPTAKEPGWVVVDVVPVAPLKRPVTLQEIKSDPRFKNLLLVRQGRLSVLPVSKPEFDAILQLSRS